MVHKKDGKDKVSLLGNLIAEMKSEVSTSPVSIFRWMLFAPALYVLILFSLIRLRFKAMIAGG